MTKKLYAVYISLITVFNSCEGGMTSQSTRIDIFIIAKQSNRFTPLFQFIDIQITAYFRLNQRRHTIQTPKNYFLVHQQTHKTKKHLVKMKITSKNVLQFVLYIAA